MICPNIEIYQTCEINVKIMWNKCEISATVPAGHQWSVSNAFYGLPVWGLGSLSYFKGPTGHVPHGPAWSCMTFWAPKNKQTAAERHQNPANGAANEPLCSVFVASWAPGVVHSEAKGVPGGPQSPPGSNLEHFGTDLGGISVPKWSPEPPRLHFWTVWDRFCRSFGPLGGHGGGKAEGKWIRRASRRLRMA